MKTCTVDGCDLPFHARERCAPHYYRWRRSGFDDPAKPVRRTTRDRIRQYTEIDDETGCWNWIAYRNPSGYGVVRTTEGCRPAYRVSWQLVNGPVPAGLELDHLCRNRACCNPAHLEAVTHAENVRRSVPATRTHCAQGHPFAGDNLVMHMENGRRRRRCRTCVRKRRRDFADRQRLAKADAA